MLTSKQLSTELGISRTTIGRLRTESHLKACICNDHGEWLYWPPGPIPSPANHAFTTSADHVVTSTAGGAL
jgi:hypothetical protein